MPGIAVIALVNRASVFMFVGEFGFIFSSPKSTVEQLKINEVANVSKPNFLIIFFIFN
jgi:hypothetical protein